MRAELRGAFAAACLMLAAEAGAQGAGRKWYAGHYEVDCDNVGVQGSQILTVWGFGKSEDAAVREARRNAVKALLFRGVSTTMCSIPEIVRPARMTERAAAYFDDFFRDKGPYLGYIEEAGDAVIDAMRVGKEHKVATVVVVNVARLRRDLEERGILSTLGGAFERKP